MTEEKTYTIRDIETLSGVKAHTIRIWEQRYAVVEPLRTGSNTRRYTDAQVKRLLNLALLNRKGFRISSLAELSDTELSEKVLCLPASAQDESDAVEDLIISLLEADDDKFESILSASVMRLGFEKAFLHLLIPFFERLGVLWQAGTITVAQEHLVSNVVRKKLLAAIDALPASIKRRPEVFLLFLPDNEQHELGILFSHYLIRKHGFPVIYLGTSTPLNDLKDIARIRRVDYLLTAITTSPPVGEKLRRYLSTLACCFPDKRILVSGSRFTENPSLNMPYNIRVLRCHSELVEFINSL